MIDETRTFNAALEERLATEPPVHTVPVEETRRVRRAGGGVFPPPVRLEHARELTIQSRAGKLRLRLLAPDRPRGAYLHIHGGGWTLGAADLQDGPLWELAEATGFAVVSVDYRLAPEHPHPAAADDCEDAARWLIKSELSDGVLTIGGESAGAHLAMLTLLRLRERRSSRKFGGANLVSGCYDVSLTPSARRWGNRQLVLSTPTLAWFADNLCPQREAEERRNPSISPLFADLHDLPPCFLTVGTLDPLVDDSLFLHQRLRAAGTRSELNVVEEGVHGFNVFPTSAAREATAAIHRFLAGVS